MEPRRNRRVPVWASGWQRRHYPDGGQSSDDDAAPTRRTPLRGRPTSGASTPTFGDPEVEEDFDDYLDLPDTTSRTSPSARSPTSLFTCLRPRYLCSPWRLAMPVYT